MIQMSCMSSVYENFGLPAIITHGMASKLGVRGGKVLQCSAGSMVRFVQD